VVGADLVRQPPDVGVVEIAAYQHDVRSPSRLELGQARGEVSAHDAQGRGRPTSSGCSRVMAHVELNSGRASKAQHVVEQLVVSRGE
jgi:hypothetical protein